MGRRGTPHILDSEGSVSGMARRTEPKSQDAQDRPRAARSESSRHKIRLATFGTAIGIVTSFVTIALGAFDLREKVASVDAKNLSSVSPAYVQGVGEVCDEREDAQVSRRADALRLKRQIKKTRTFARQRILILASIHRELNRGDHALAAFEGLTPPEDVAREHRAVVRRWETNIDLVRVHRDAVEASTSRPRLIMVLVRLDRSAVETESRRVEAGLRRLGGTACDIGRPKPVPQVFLPPVAQTNPDVEPPPTATPPPSDQTPSDSEVPPPDPDIVTPDALPPTSDPEVQPPPTIRPPADVDSGPSQGSVQEPRPNTVTPRLGHPRPPR